MRSATRYCFILLLAMSSAWCREQEGNLKFVECVEDGWLRLYSFNPDSSVTRREYGGRWKSKSYKIGTWTRKQGVLILMSDTKLFTYETDSLRHLRFLISQSAWERWDALKLKMTRQFEEDETLKMLTTFTERKSVEAHARAEEKVEYELAITLLCGEDVFVWLPQVLRSD